MPSWEVHRKVGELLLGYSDTEVDKLVDCYLGHDTTRYDPDKVIKLIENVLRCDNDRVRYAILHHYLDRLVDLVSMFISRLVEFCVRVPIYCPDVCEPFSKIEKFVVQDACNIFNLFITNPEELINFVYTWYYDSRRRRVKVGRVELWIEKIRELEATRPVLYKYIRDRALEVVEKLRRKLKMVLKVIMLEDEQVSRKLIYVTAMKIAGEVYRRGQETKEQVEKRYAGTLEKIVNEIVSRCLS